MFNIQVYEDDVYDVKLSKQEELVFFHVDVKRELTKADVKMGKEIFKEVKASLISLGYPRLYAYTPKIKFARLIGPGFIHLQEIPNEDGPLDLIVWELLEG